MAASPNVVDLSKLSPKDVASLRQALGLAPAPALPAVDLSKVPTIWMCPNGHHFNAAELKDANRARGLDGREGTAEGTSCPTCNDPHLGAAPVAINGIVVKREHLPGLLKGDADAMKHYRADDSIAVDEADSTDAETSTKVGAAAGATKE